MIKPLLGLLFMYVVHDLVSEEVGARVRQAAPLAATPARCLEQCSALFGPHPEELFMIHPRLTKILNLSRVEPGGTTTDARQTSRDEATHEDCSGNDLAGSLPESDITRADILQYTETHSSGQIFAW